MRLSDALFARLKQETDCVFVIPGGSSMFLVDALGRSGLRHVSMIHEAGAGIAALGYAMASGKLGVCLTISGPGATNAITACLAAWTDSIPVLFISGQARTEFLGNGTRSSGLQYAPIIDMVRPITKLAWEAVGVGSIDTLDLMITQCMTGRRGPCWLSIPQDIQAVEL